ncbi:hypothetical protein ABGB07_13755 [Micromonosporaceae bacterium B7E4]
MTTDRLLDTAPERVLASRRTWYRFSFHKSLEGGDDDEQTPATGLDRYGWFGKCPGATEFTAIASEVAAAYTFTATAQLDNCQYLVRLYRDGDALAAESAPVTLNVEDADTPASSQDDRGHRRRGALTLTAI